MPEDYQNVADALGIPPSETADEKEVYAFLGLAVFEAVGLEKLIAQALTVDQVWEIKGGSRDERLARFDEAFTQYSRMTLGRLLKACEGAKSIDESTKLAIEKALPVRNSIVHRLAWDSAEKFCTEAGRRMLIADLRRDLVLIGKATHLLEEEAHRRGAMLGVTPEIVAAMEAKLLKDAKLDNGPV